MAKAKKPAKRKPGQPTKFSNALAIRMCTEIATTSKSLRTICAMPGMPSVATVLNWLRDNKNFLAQYTRAKQEQADMLVEDMLDIADNGANDTVVTDLGAGLLVKQVDKDHINRSRLRVDTRKWIASKLKPKKYGDKLDVNTTTKVINVTVPDDDNG